MRSKSRICRYPENVATEIRDSDFVLNSSIELKQFLIACACLPAGSGVSCLAVWLFLPGLPGLRGVVLQQEWFHVPSDFGYRVLCSFLLFSSLDCC
jgi:hypothetical protein